jgi:hypothetical protein
VFNPFHKLPYTYPYGRYVDETMTRAVPATTRLCAHDPERMPDE